MTDDLMTDGFDRDGVAVVHPVGAMVALIAMNLMTVMTNLTGGLMTGRRRGPPGRGDDRFDREDLEQDRL